MKLPMLQLTVVQSVWILLLSVFLASGIIDAPLLLSANHQQAQAKTYTGKGGYGYYKPTASKSKNLSEMDSLIEQQRASAKWAAVVVDANRGKIIYEDSAEEIRHPASLTKMMTLYLLFEAIEAGKLSGKTKMPVSTNAASQPQTNLSLKRGQSISASDAIRALVIRSANDVAVVVAEYLAGSVSGFAKKMNRKAKDLGMTKTKFYNPHGLPDKRQVTTALDMAKLSIALRRDFPGYYHHFKRTSFRYNGKTYKSHNRVLGKMPGVDGLKTGYIRMSGFNLATSLTRGQLRLVGVVMGGITGAARDQEMINMLDANIEVARRLAEEARLAKLEEDRKAKERAEQLARLEAERQQGEYAGEYALAEAKVESIESRDLPTSPVQPRSKLDQTSPYLSGKNWGVQVGAFPTIEQAERAAASARRLVPTDLATSQLHISQVTTGGRLFNRSRLLYLSAQQARKVCDQLAAARKQCMVIRMEN